MRNRKIEIERKKREIEKKGKRRDLFPLLLLFEHEGPKVSVFVWLCRDLLVEYGSSGVSRSRRIATRRESIRGVRSRRFLCFFLFIEERIFLSSSRLVSDDRRYMSYRILR